MVAIVKAYAKILLTVHLKISFEMDCQYSIYAISLSLVYIKYFL